MATKTVRLTWKDTNEIEMGYKVYRSDTMMDINNMPQPIATLDSNVTEYLDDDRVIGDIYYYIVSAYSPDGEEFSDELELTVEEIIKVYAGGNTDRLKSYNPTDGSILWERYLGDNNQNINIIDYKNERIYVTGGYTASYGILACYNVDGDLIWDHNIGALFYDISPSDDNSVILSHGMNYSIQKLDSSGNVVWTKTRPSAERAMGVYEKDGVYYAGRGTTSISHINTLNADNGNIILTSDTAINHAFGTFQMYISGDILYTFSYRNGILSRFNKDTLTFIDNTTTYLHGGYIDEGMGILVNYESNGTTINVYDVVTEELLNTLTSPYSIRQAHVDNSGRFAVIHTGGITYLDSSGSELWTNSSDTGLQSIFVDVI